MGIQGLLPFLEKSSRPINISEFSGATVAVDAYCWLHKGAFSCAEKLARGEKCNAYVYYCMKFITMLLSHNIKPILVFDGRHLPAKADTEKKRRDNRELNRRRAAELLRQDKPDQAKVYIRRCVDITHSMALELMQECRKYNIDCITAPYEADSQLAYLSITGIAHLVITEDSDLLLFGCDKVVFKMDVNGGGQLIEKNKLHLALKLGQDKYDFDKFRRMCILSGCDYLPSLPGIGLNKARKFITRTLDPDIHRALTRMSSYLNMPSLIVTQEYRDAFIHSEAMFKYQPVFDPIQRKVVPLTPIGDESPPLKLTAPLPDDQAYQLALGNLDPFTLKTVCDWDPDNREQVKAWGRASCSQISIWSKEFKIKPPPPPRNSKVHRPLSTAGKQLSQKTDNILLAPSVAIIQSDAEIESILMDCDFDISAPPVKKICLDENKKPETIMPNRRSLSPDLSENKHSSKVCKIYNNKRHTIITESNKVLSRYFFSSSKNTSDTVKQDLCVSLPNNETKERDSNLKLKDLSNKLNSETGRNEYRKISPNKYRLDVKTQDDIEDVFVVSEKSECDSALDVTEENLSFSFLSQCSNESTMNNLSRDSVSSRCSLDSESVQSSQQSNKSSNSLFKWKSDIHKRFGFTKTKIQCSRSKFSNKDFQSPKNIELNNSDACSKESTRNLVNEVVHNEEKTFNNSDNVHNGKDSNSTESEYNSVEKKKTSNPFKVNRNTTATSPKFNLLRDPVPDNCSKDMDESFKVVVSPAKTTSQLSSETKSNISSAKKSLNVGLNRKTTKKPVQKSLISMFMLQSKRKLKC